MKSKTMLENKVAKTSENQVFPKYQIDTEGNFGITFDALTPAFKIGHKKYFGLETEPEVFNLAKPEIDKRVGKRIAAGDKQPIGVMLAEEIERYGKTILKKA